MEEGGNERGGEVIISSTDSPPPPLLAASKGHKGGAKERRTAETFFPQWRMVHHKLNPPQNLPLALPFIVSGVSLLFDFRSWWREERDGFPEKRGRRKKL